MTTAPEKPKALYGASAGDLRRVLAGKFTLQPETAKTIVDYAIRLELKERDDEFSAGKSLGNIPARKL